MKSKFRLIIFVILLVLGIGVGYAMLSSNLKIVGSSGIKSGKWIIYFDRIQNESGVVSTNTKITNNKTQVDFNIALTKPGDYYEFDVDTVNDGTIDAMIDSVEFGDIDDSLKDIITFDVTYKDGTEIQKCDVLPKESRRTITVKVNYEYDIDKREILNEETNMNLTFTINYVQDSVCEQYPTLIVDPNGGKYNGTKKLTKLKVEKNSDTVLNVPTRDGYEFLYFENEDNTPLEKDDEGKTTVHVGDTDKKVTAVWEEDSGPKYILTIDPNGGIYDGKSENTIVGLSEGKTLTLEDPIKDGYIFAGWEEVTETAALSGSTVTMPALAVTVKAIWKTEADYVARIENRYYETIQKAYDAAVDGDKVWLLKSTTENATNIKNISFDLGGFTVTGTITNTGTLTIDNGKIQNTESSPFVNIGTVNVGTHDGNMIADSIIIDAGEDVNGLTQNGTFNFYDGYIIGKIAVTDIYNELEEGYYYIVDSLTNNDETKHWQKAYLSPTIDAIVKKIINNRDVYYKLLQDGVDASTNDNPNIYAIKNFPDSHQTVIGENQIILFDICGFNIDEGAAIINNGTLTITDSAETKGSMIVREAIVNNGTLSISDISLSQGDTGKNLLENSGNLNVTNSTLIGTDKYALDIKTGGNLVFDNSTTIRADEYGIYNESSEAVTITGGNIVGIYNDGDNLTIKNSSIVNGNDLTIYSSRGNLVLDSITANYTRSDRYYLLRIDGGEASIINGNYDASGTGVILVKRATLGIDGATLTANGMGINADNSTVTFTSGEITSGSYSVQNGGTSAFYINGGKMKSTGSHTLFLFSGTVYVNGGEVVNNYNVATTIDNDYDGNVVINGGLVKAEGNKLALYCNSRSSATINGGTIISTGGTAIYNNRTLTVTGGTIIGANYGIENDEKLIIGNNSDEVKTDSPIIRGETYGVYSTDTMSFYDGILEGKTDGYYGTITAVPSNYEVVKGTIEIDGVTYNEEHLAVKKDFLQVGNTKFNSLQAAIDSIDGEGTILVIADSNINEASTIPNTKTINFDLNGHKLLSTETITNNGTLNLKDSVLNSVGEFASYNVNLITNNKNVEFLSGNYKSNCNVLYQNNSSAVSTISGGYLLSTGGATVRNANGTLVVNDGEIEENTNDKAIWGTVTINGGYIHSVGDAINGSVTLNGGKVYSSSRIAINGGTLTIHAGEISTDSGTGILCGTCTIDGGKISSKTGTSIFSNIGSRVTISDGEFTSLSGKAFSGGRSSRIDISGGLFKSIDGYAYRDDSYSNPTITGGTFISENSTAIYLTDGSGFKLEDAYVEGKVYGVYINHSGFNFVLGKEGEGVVTNTPVVIGGSEGVHIVSGNFDFYDGIVKGVDNSYNTTIRTVEDSYVIKDDTEVIEGVTYKTAYPGPETDFLEVNGQTYNSLKKAINAIETTGTIKVIENKVINSASTIDSGKNITLDLNGKELTLYQPITNQGIFTVVDNGTDGKLSSFATTAIDNKGTLNITSGIYDVSQKLVTNTTSGTTITISDVAINSNGNALDISNSTLNMSNVTFTANTGYPISTKSSTVTADNINITTAGNGIYNNNGDFTLSNSTITSSGISFVSSGTETLTDCVLTSTGSASIYRDSFSGTLTINSGTYSGTNSISQNMGNTQVNGGNFIASSMCFYVNTGVLTIGSDDSNININSPVIQGGTYGIYTVNGPTIYFYDGIIKGKTAVSSTQLVNIATDSFIRYDTEVVDENNTYNIAYLLKNSEFIENQSTHDRFSNFNEAVEAANNNDELKLIDNGSLFYDVEIPNKKLTLNMNNYKIDTIKTIVNNGELTIIDDSNEKGGTFSTSVNISVIQNNNKLSISDTKITTSASSQYMIKNTTSGSVLSLDNVTISSTYSIDNTQSVSISNSNISAVKNDTGNVSVDGSTINTSMNALYNYNGILSVTNSSATSTTVGGSTHYAYYNNVTDENILKNTIDKTNLYSGTYGDSIGNANGTLEVKNQSNVYKGFDNQANLNVLNSYISSSNNDNISNSGILVIDSSTTDFNRFTNSGTATFDDSTLNCVKYIGDTYIYNNGDMTLSSSTINSTDAKTIISNTSNLNINSSNIIADYTSRKDAKGIDNSGIVNLNSGSVEIKNAGTVYGLYLTGGFVDVKNFEINVYDSNNSYGAYVENGTLTIGENEDPLNVSTTTPLISAIGTTSGIGVKKISGEIYYYDGKIIGSTDAQPEAPTALASSRYRRVFTRDVNDYETCILEYVP